MFATKLLDIATLAKPVVPVSPVTVKLNSRLSELKASADNVEFDDTENTFWSSKVLTESILNDSPFS